MAVVTTLVVQKLLAPRPHQGRRRYLVSVVKGAAELRLHGGTTMRRVTVPVVKAWDWVQGRAIGCERVPSRTKGVHT